MRKYRTFIIVVVGLLLAVLCAGAAKEEVYAKKATTEIQSTIMDKSIYQGVYNCYNGGYIINSFPTLENYDGVIGLVKDGSKDKSGNTFVPLVTGVDAWSSSAHRYSASNNALSCYNLFAGGVYVTGGGGRSSNLLDAMGKTVPPANDTDKAVEFMENMGYSVQKGAENNDTCYSLPYQLVTMSGVINPVEVLGEIMNTNKICQDGNGKLYTDGHNSTGKVELGTNSSGSEVCLLFGPGINVADKKIGCASLGSSGFTQGGLLDSVANVITKKCTRSSGVYDCDMRGGPQEYPLVHFRFTGQVNDDLHVGQTTLSSYSASFKNNDSKVAALSAIKFLSNGNRDVVDAGDNGILVSDLEKRVLYQAYLETFYQIEVDCTAGIVTNDSFPEIKWFKDGTIRTCHYDKSKVDKASKRNKPVNGVENGWFKYNSISNLNALLAEIGKLRTEYTEEEIEEIEQIIETPTEGGGGSTGTDSCRTQGKSLGWLLCSILDFAEGAATDLYNGFVKDALQVKPELFQPNSSGTNYTKEAWDVFQRIANIAFIILLLLVIFSQLTGVGIDNYGIKKILPKLIVTAILVNLSYYICVIAVDLSNILGNGLQALFEGLSVSAPSSYTMEGGTINIVGGGITAIGVLGGIAAVGAVIVNPAILLSLLVSVLGVLISMLFMFVLLSVRQAAIVILTVASPIALVCYMLPNTKKVFDIWKKAGTALLMLYPICGLLIGGGNYVSNLLLAVNPNGGFFMALTAMVIGIAPIFFIPMLLKNSFSALGNIGAKISGLGEKVRGGAVRGMRGTDAYKNAQERGAERRTRIRAGVDRDGNARELSGLGKFLRGGSRNVARSRSQYLKNQDSKRREENLLGGGFVADMAGIEAKADADKVSNAEAMLSYGKVGVNGGAVGDDNPAVNTNDAKSMKAYHAAALARYRNASSDAERSDAMAEIKAAQNIMSKTDKGRAAIQANYEDAVRAGNVSGLNVAASHIMSNFADKYKSVNRGAHAMISDMATGRSWSEVRSNIESQAYDKVGTDKYTEESLAGADDAALDRLISSMNNGVMGDSEKADIQSTAARALQKMQTGNLNVKPEVAKKLETIASGYAIAGGNTGSGSTGGNGGAVEGESFNVRGGDSGSGAAPSAPASNPAPASGNSAPAGSPAASPAPSNPPARPVNPLTTPAQSSESAQPSRSQADRTQPGEGPRIQIASEGDFQSFMRDRHS